MSEQEYLRPSHLLIDTAAILENFRNIQRFVNSSKVMPILKANAYGHGLLETASLLEGAGAEYFGVAFLEEALELRRHGVRTPILTLGGLSGRQIGSFIDHDVDILASSIMKLEATEQAAEAKGKRARIHLKIDTGMERLGIHHFNAEKLLESAIRCTHVDIVGISSHLATSERADTSFASLQLERFLEVCSFFEKRSLPTPLRHIANSGAILQLPGSHLDMVRPGLILYGQPPDARLEGIVPLKPAMQLKSEVVYFKVIGKGVSVSYDQTWTASEQTRIVTIPIGYGDGYPRRLSNLGQVLIRGKRHSIVGKVCMDQLMVNIGAEGVAYNGDEVVLLGSQNDQQISLLELSSLLNTDPRDILVGLNLRLPRQFI